MDLTGLAYLVALAIAAFLGYKLYKGGQVAVSAAVDAVHSAVQSIGAPIEAAQTAIVDLVYREPRSVANINAPVIAPPPPSQRTGTVLFPSGNFVGDLEDATGFYSSPYALTRDSQ